MAHQRWNEQGRDDERGSTRDDRGGRRDRFGDGDEARGTYGRRQFSDDANQGGYAQGQYARERGRHEQSGYGHGGRDGQGSAGQGGRREHWMGSDDERLRADWESSRYGSGGGWSRNEQGGGSGGGNREGGWGREGGGRGGDVSRGGFAQPGYDDRNRWSGRDDEHRGNFGRGFTPRARDLVGGGRSDQRGVSWTAERGPEGEPRWSRERGDEDRGSDRSRRYGGERAYDRDRGFGGERAQAGERGYGGERGGYGNERGYGSERGGYGSERGGRGNERGTGGERSFGAREEPRYRAEPGGRPGGSPWHADDDRSPSGGYGRSGRSGGDYGRFDNDDQDIRVHGGRLKSRDDDDHRYGMGLQGGAGRGRWVTDPRVDDDEERFEGRERGSWGRQVWAEDERYQTRGGPEARRPDDRDDENRFRRSDEAEPWRSHGRSDRDRDEEDRGGSPVPWRTGNLGARGWSDRDRNVN